MNIKQLLSKYGMFIRYVIIGLLTTAINFVVFYIFKFLGVNYLIANTIAWFASVVFAFFMNKQIVFRSAYTSRKAFIIELVEFFALRGVSLLLDDGLMFLGISVMHLPMIIVKIGTQVIVIISNYIFSKLIFVKPSSKGE